MVEKITSFVKKKYLLSFQSLLFLKIGLTLCSFIDLKTRVHGFNVKLHMIMVVHSKRGLFLYYSISHGNLHCYFGFTCSCSIVE